jgi:chemotaxis response regulator CheB
MLWRSTMAAKKRQTLGSTGRESGQRGENGPPKSGSLPGALASSSAFPVVGMRVSAGGFEAFKWFSSVTPSENGIALALIPHIDSVYRDLVVDLLSRHSSTSVRSAREEMPIAH